MLQATWIHLWLNQNLEYFHVYFFLLFWAQFLADLAATEKKPEVCKKNETAIDSWQDPRFLQGTTYLYKEQYDTSGYFRAYDNKFPLKQFIYIVATIVFMVWVRYMSCSNSIKYWLGL